MKRIQDKLLIVLIAVSFLPLIVIEYLTLQSAEESQASYKMDSLDSILTQKIKLVDKHFIIEQDRAQLLANTPKVTQNFLSIVNGFRPQQVSDEQLQHINEVAPFLKYFQEKGKLHNLYLIAKNGDIVYSVRQAKDHGTNLINGLYNRTQLANVIQQVMKTKEADHSKFTHYIGDNNIFSAFVAAPIIINGTIEGVVALQLTTEALYEITQDYTALQNTGETVLAKLDGDHAVFISPLRFNQRATNEVKVLINSDNGMPIQEAVQGISGKGFSVDYRNIDIIAAWRYLSKYNLGMVVKIDQTEAFSDISKRRMFVAVMALSIILPFIIIAFFISRRVTKPIIEMVLTTKSITDGNWDQHIPIRSNDEVGQLASSINEMSSHIKRAFDERESKRWLQDGIESLSQTMRGNQISTDLADNIVAFVSHYLDAKVGSLYILKSQELELIGGYAFVPHFGNQVIELGDGIVGQAAKSKKPCLLTDVPEDYVSISSSMGEIQPSTLLVYPIIKEDTVIAVMELGWLANEHPQTYEYLEAVCESVATALGIAESHHKLQTLLDQSQQQMEELQVREEELRAINDEVEQRSTQLAQSQKELEIQSEELHCINEALEHKTESLEKQNSAVEAKNKVIETARQELQNKAEQLEASSRYKSEFLANMSHELRTPLNSMLILSRILYDNDEKNLDEDQVESAKVIHNSGQELLSLINDILDLSKIEAGKMETYYEAVSLHEITSELNGQFKAIAQEKGLELKINIDNNVPDSIVIDIQKTQQILKNLLSNSLKFTEVGQVMLNAKVVSYKEGMWTQNDNMLAISIIDTGIGISKEKQASIFESFQQADGSTSRKYGGTGLGLTISRQLIDLLQGELGLSSEEDKGSTFTLYLPLNIAQDASSIYGTDFKTQYQSEIEIEIEAETDTASFIQSINQSIASTAIDDIDNITSNDNNIIVIIEDDPTFSKVLAQLAKKSGYKCAIADNGLQGIEYVSQYSPCGVILDLGLPDMSGVNILDVLKKNPKTSNIPIHVISGQAKSLEIRGKGAQGYHQKPVAREQINLILSQLKEVSVRKNDGKSDSKINILMHSTLDGVSALDLSFLDHEATNIIKVGSLDELSHRLGNSPEPISGIIINLEQVDTQTKRWFDDFYQFNGEIDAPIILCLQQEPAMELLTWLEKYDCHVIINGTQAAQRLQDEVELFLSNVDGNFIVDTTVHKDTEIHPISSTVVPSQLPKEPMLSEASKEQAAYVSVEGCNVLLVDDDLRNTFALSKVLKKQGMKVTLADNGKMALEKLEEHGGIDVVLMDIMMPVMDGHEAMRQIRLQPIHKTLPIIALTAKAMQEDRRKCVEAGASDYLIKPVDVDKLVAMMRVWLY
ncbi:MAG: response regulator, partial [Gammaproteobacteria bacterium]|nr:response regulator [Gammaproteobacteria bacterium]